MLARVSTVAFSGIETAAVDVQARVSPGVPHFAIVGLGGKAVSESRERLRAAFGAIGMSLPAQRIVINLAPADLPKEGSHYDLPIALALFVALGILPPGAVADYLVLGELSLDGGVGRVNGVLPAAIAAHARGKGIICPQENGSEAAWAGEDVGILAPDSLVALLNHFRGIQLLAPPRCHLVREPRTGPDLVEVRGQGTGRRALEICAAGRHNLLMSGPPGAGKSMLAACMPGLLPDMSSREMLEASMIASLAGDLPGGGLVSRRPFRAPHHSASMAALVGGGPRARPGEITMAHHGVLFLDELPEFSQTALDALRQPLETGRVVVARANAHVTWPASFQLVAAMNPCRCGWLGDEARACPRAPRCGTDYRARISGPLLDRFDVMLEIPAIPLSELSSARPGEASRTVATRIRLARERQYERSRSLGQTDVCNAAAGGDFLESITASGDGSRDMLAEAAERFRLTARGYYRVLRVARTIADLAGETQVGRAHLAEALTYRLFPFAAVPPGGGIIRAGARE